MVALAETREAGSRWVHADAAGIYQIDGVTQLIRVVVNTPVDAATVVVADGVGLAAVVLAVIDASKRDIGVVYHATIQSGSITYILDDDVDVTVTYD